MSIRMLGLCLLALAFSPCLRAEPVRPSPAPDLGPEKYTDHASGALVDVISALARITGSQIMFVPLPRTGAAPPKPVEETPVVLNLDNATFGDILSSLVAQAPVVYEVPQGGPLFQGPPITIRPGDPKVDARPTCRLDDYILRVTHVMVTRTREENLRWGATAPDCPPSRDNLDLAIEIIALSPDAALRLAGVQARAANLPDADRRAGSATGPPGTNFNSAMHDPTGTLFLPISLLLPAPDPLPKAITRLEGSLALFSQIKTAEIHIPPDSQGKAFTQDDVTVTVRDWRRNDTVLTVSIECQCPPLPHNDALGWVPHERFLAVLVGADGRRAQGAFTRQSFSGRDTNEVGFMFQLQPATPGAPPPPLEPKELILTVHRFGTADKTLPFVIENIPLP